MTTEKETTMATQAQNKATANYRREHVRQLVVRFYPKDAELFDFVKASGGTSFLKQLAAAAMSTERGDERPLPIG